MDNSSLPSYPLLHRLRLLSARRLGVLPGFGLAMGFTLSYLGLIVLLPMAALVFKALGLGPKDIILLVQDPRVLAALKLSFISALAAALFNVVFGLVLGWTLVRYDFWGRKVLDAMIDLPFALPTAIAGIALAALYAPSGWLGKPLSWLGIEIAYTPLGIVVALVFIGLPFVVRTVQPVLEDLDQELEEVAATLGASRLNTLWRVIFPQVIPALLTGFSLALARGLGEYGSVIFIAGNIPYESEIAPLLIVIRLEEFNYQSATALAFVMLLISFISLLAINLLQAWSRKRTGRG